MNKQLAGDQGTEHFARVVPIVGTYLREKVVALVGTAQIAPISMLAEYLAACGVRRWVVPQGPAADALEQRLGARHGTALALELVCGLAGPCAEGHTPDLVIAAGRPGELQSALAYADRSDCPALLIGYSGGWSTAIHMPGHDCGASEWIASLPVGLSHHTKPERLDWDVVTVLPLLAGVARALLLRDTLYRRDDLAAIWQAGLWQVHFPTQAPLQVAWQAGGPAPAVAETPFRSPAGGQGTVLVAGLGSIGSVAAAWLAHTCERLVLVDPDHVDATNPVRQEFQIADVGLPKAEALAARLGGITPTVAYQQALRSEADVAQIVARHGIGAALVATGTSADFAIARALRACGVAHVVARCYPRALYWEAVLVDGARGPAFDDIRGHVTPGPVAAPTPEQIAAYSDAGALEAEPATLVESGWAAAWAARLAAQFLLPQGLRERWFLELVMSGSVCLVGGGSVQHTPHGPAYGVAWPGQIHAWRREHIYGTARQA